MTIPFTFGNQSGNVPASELDANWAYLQAFAATIIVVVDAVPNNVTDAGPAINTALTTAATSSQGGRVAMLPGIYKVSTEIDIPDNVTLDMGGASFTLAAKITLGNNSKLVCNPGAMRTDTTDNAGKITQFSGANLAHMIEVTGNYGVIDNILIDGAKSINASGGVNVYITGNRASLFRVTSRNAKTHGIEFFSTGTDDLACCAKLVDVMSLDNDGNGMLLKNTADIFVCQSEFESNALSGIECDNSPTMRIVNSDMGGNTLHGLHVHGAAFNPGVSLGSQLQIVTGCQFGNNVQYDALFDGTSGGTWGNVVTGCSFIGSQSRTPSNTYSAIKLIDNTDGCNSITGNFIFSPAGPNQFKYGIEIAESSPANEGYDIAAANTFGGTFGTSAFVGVGRSTFGLNSDGTTGINGIFNLNQLSINSDNSSRKLIVSTDTQFDGLQLQNSSNAVAALFGNDAGNDGGGLALNSGGVLKVEILATGGSYLSDFGLFIGSTKALGNGQLGLVPQAFSALPSPSADIVGTMACVNNSTTATWGATIGGGGGNVVMAVCGSSHWTVMGVCT